MADADTDHADGAATSGRSDAADASGEDADVADGAADSDGSDAVDIPWIEGSVPLPEAVEILARAAENDEDLIDEVVARVERTERRLDALEDGSSVECPSCGAGDAVYTAGVGAAKLADGGSLSDANAAALNRDSHVCLDCREAFTPSPERSE